tara:strand:+ start:236 stop:421 length:186 start_codon:yes stop_codon:yes gene_type:complete
MSASDSGKNYALFGNTENGDYEQLTHWDDFKSATKSKAKWYEKTRATYILKKVSSPIVCGT